MTNLPEFFRVPRVFAHKAPSMACGLGRLLFYEQVQGTRLFPGANVLHVCDRATYLESDDPTQKAYMHFSCLADHDENDASMFEALLKSQPVLNTGKERRRDLCFLLPKMTCALLTLAQDDSKFSKEHPGLYHGLPGATRLTAAIGANTASTDVRRRTQDARKLLECLHWHFAWKIGNELASFEGPIISHTNEQWFVHPLFWQWTTDETPHFVLLDRRSLQLSANAFNIYITLVQRAYASHTKEPLATNTDTLLYLSGLQHKKSSYLWPEYASYRPERTKTWLQSAFSELLQLGIVEEIEPDWEEGKISSKQFADSKITVAFPETHRSFFTGR